MENITLKHIMNRRSIRKYINKPIPPQLITDLLKAAMNAPSACNQHICHFVLLENRKILNELSGIHGGYHTLKYTPLAILVCADPEAAILPSFWEHDCAAATQNLLIAAESLGLGAVWQGVNPAAPADADVITKCVGLPEYIHPFSIISLGYPDETPAAKCSFDESKIHYSSKW